MVIGRVAVVASSILCFALMSCRAPGDREETRSPTTSKDRAPSSDPSKFADYRRLMEETKAVEGKLASGKLGGVDRLLTFDQVGAWEYVDGLKGIPAEVKALDGLIVVMVGYLLPFDADSFDTLIVESPTQMEVVGAPPTNRMVRVVMTSPPGAHLFRPPVMVVGKFSVRAATIDGYCDDIYQIDAERVESLGDDARLPNR